MIHKMQTLHEVRERCAQLLVNIYISPMLVKFCVVRVLRESRFNIAYNNASLYYFRERG